MKVLDCAAARARLQAFHDAELPISEQIAVNQHLEWCDDCVATLEGLRDLRAALRSAALGRIVEPDEASFQSSVLTRAKAEETFSLVGRVRTLFDDMHLMYVTAGAAAATFVCVAIVSGMLHFATTERPDSLAALANLLASPGSNENPVILDPTMLMPRALDEAFATSSSGDDAFYTLSAVVTREGRVENLELLHAIEGSPIAQDAKRVESLLDSVARARFEPARAAGAPVAVNMVWVVAHTTVRGDKPFEPRLIRGARKRTAALARDLPAAV